MIKILEQIFEIFGWIKIFLSPTLIAAFFGVVIFSEFKYIYGLITAIIILIAGIMIGIKWANNVWRRTSTQEYLARTSASPDFDELSKLEGKEKQ